MRRGGPSHGGTATVRYASRRVRVDLSDTRVPVQLTREGAAAARRPTMPLTLAELEELQTSALADDVVIELEEMSLWTAEQVLAYFESGGADRPASAHDALRDALIEAGLSAEQAATIYSQRSRMLEAAATEL
eukprot:4895088-Prymnesium_polylepis.1